MSLAGAQGLTEAQEERQHSASEDKAPDHAGYVQAQMQLAGASLQAVGRDHEELLYGGQLSLAVAELQEAAMAGGPWQQLVAGNMLWQHAPEVSLMLHEAAQDELPDSHSYSVELELALGYTRADRCEEAIERWQSMRADNSLPEHAGYVAAYCYMKQGDPREALRIVTESRFAGSHVSAEKLTYSVFGGPYPIQRYDDAYRRAQSGDGRAMDELLLLAVHWPTDWWNQNPNAAALRHARQLMPTVWPEDSRAHREWECFWDQLDSSAAVEPAMLADCGVLVEDHPYPASSALGEILLPRWSEHDPTDLLARFRPTLWMRATSEQGDLSALRVLANLQARAGAHDELADTDELGWKRYRARNFAISRLGGLAADGPASPEYAAALDQATVDFPEDPYLRALQLSVRYPEGDFRIEDLAAVILAESRSFQIAVTSAHRSSLQLRALYFVLESAIDEDLGAGRD